jgi:pyruvate-formate lyase
MRALMLNAMLAQQRATDVTRTKAEEFLRLAQECRATAQTLSTEQARAEMLAMADVCDRVAAQPTDGTGVSETEAVVRLMTSSNLAG